MAPRRSCCCPSSGPSEMGQRRWLLCVWASGLALGVFFTGVGQGAELSGATSEEAAEGGARKGNVVTFWLSRLTTHQRHKATIYRPGSLSALSRGLLVNLSIPGEVQRQEREASPTTRDACWGCCGTPNHTESREPAVGGQGQGSLGTTPRPKPPRRNTTRVFHRPGAYTPMGKTQQGPTHRPVEGQQLGSSSGTKGGTQGTGATERCQGCCWGRGATGGKPPGREEEGKVSPPSEGSSSSQRPWRPIVGRETPSYRSSSQKEGNNGWSSFSGGDGQQPHRRQ